jgi:hypothetical protein
MAEFHVDHASLNIVTTSRGINAYGKIFNTENQEVGTVDDDASSIVAKVFFSNPEVRQRFLDEAKAGGHGNNFGDNCSDAVRISEYARRLTDQAHEMQASVPKKSNRRPR